MIRQKKLQNEITRHPNMHRSFQNKRQLRTQYDVVSWEEEAQKQNVSSEQVGEWWWRCSSGGEATLTCFNNLKTTPICFFSLAPLLRISSLSLCMCLSICDCKNLIIFLILWMNFTMYSGKTSLLFQFAWNVAALHSNSSNPNVLFICNRHRLDSKPPFLSQVSIYLSNLFHSLISPIHILKPT